MIVSLCLFVYAIIGLIVAECGMNYLRENYPKIHMSMQFQPWQFVFVYVFIMIMWLPAFVQVIIKAIIEGVPEE